MTEKNHYRDDTEREEWHISHDTCQVGECDNEATKWGKMCDEHAKQRVGHPDTVGDGNGEI